MPGFIETPILDDAYGPEAAQQIRDVASKAVPVPRMGTVDDIAEAALFLASDAASYINGVKLVVDGGMTLGAWRHPDIGGNMADTVREVTGIDPTEVDTVFHADSG